MGKIETDRPNRAQGPKSTSYAYGREHQLGLLEKYRNREKNHWRFRIGLAHRLVDRWARPRLRGKAPGRTILVDVGCSIGTFAIEFAKRGFRSYGIDFDPEALRIATDLCGEEGVEAEFIRGDISDWRQDFPPIDIAICFDIFEHLHDDELGSFLTAIRKQLSDEGSLVFHSFPTRYDIIFFSRDLIRWPVLPFRGLAPSTFERIVKTYASLLDMAFLWRRGGTYRELIKTTGHCNPTTKERLADILKRAGYEILLLETSQLYPFEQRVQRQFARHPISHRNLYGVAVPAA